jgi:hypothetical protein
MCATLLDPGKRGAFDFARNKSVLVDRFEPKKSPFDRTISSHSFLKSSSSFVRLGIEAVCQDGRRIHGESKRLDFRSYHPKYGRGRRTTTTTRTIVDMTLSRHRVETAG